LAGLKKTRLFNQLIKSGYFFLFFSCLGKNGKNKAGFFPYFFLIFFFFAGRAIKLLYFMKQFANLIFSKGKKKKKWKK